jgi:glycosyltransferase involved in cell wall biosynthesis
LRVLLLSDADVFAGTERHMFDLANGLRAEGVEAWIGSPSPSVLKDRAEFVGLRHVAIQKQGLIDRPAIGALTALLRSGEVDLIHAHNGRTMLSAAIAVTRARTGKAVATQHFLEPDHAGRTGPKAFLYHAAHRWVSAKLSCYIAISEAVKESMLKRREASPDRIHVVLNGMPAIDAAELTTPGDVRQALSIPTDHLILMCAARLEHEKDIATLITAVSEVSTSHPHITCLIAGAGSLEQDLKSEIGKRSLQHTVRLLGFREDILSLIGGCDLFVLPSQAEPFGLVLLEAMAMSKPVIATNAGGPREIVVDGSTGLLIEPANPSAMANAIRAIIQDRDTMKKMGSKGYERFHERFTAQQMSQRMIAVYETVLKSNRKNTG